MKERKKILGGKLNKVEERQDRKLCLVKSGTKSSTTFRNSLFIVTGFHIHGK